MPYLKRSAWLLLLFAAFFSCDFSAREKTSAQPYSADAVAATDSLVQLSGFLQSSGLSAIEKERLGYPDIAFQLLTRQPYFLSGSDSLGQLWGKCVSIRARPVPLPDSVFAYGRKLLQVVAVFPQPYALCQFNDTLSQRPAEASQRLNGQVIRFRRPAPDIAYDYALLPEKPLYDAFSQTDPTRKIDTLPLLAFDFLSLQQLEEAVSRKKIITLEGWQQRGYAESLSFLLMPPQTVQ